MTETLLVLLIVGVAAVFLKLSEVNKHLEAICGILKWSAEGRMENEAFIDRMHKIVVSSEASSKHLKSIEERIELFTETRLQRLFSDLFTAVGTGEVADKNNSDD